MSDPIFSSPLINPLGFNDLGEAPLSDIYPNVFYAVQSAGAASALFLVDITTGEKTLIPGGTLAFATFAIARDSNTGRVYYVGTESNGSAPVAYWDPATQTNTVLPNPTGQSIQFLKLAQAQDGTIYGLGSTANLYAINPTTGVATNLGAITGGSPAFTGGSGDAAFDPNDSNTLYISVVASSQLRLYAVNVTTRVATYVGQSGLSSVTNSGALAFGEDGELYGVVTAGGGASFVRLSRTNGSVSAVIKSNSETYGDFSSLPTPTPDVDFTIVKTDGVDSIVSGANTTYTISLTNNEVGGRVLGLIVKDSIPAGVAISAWQASITNGSGESVIVNGASGNSNEILTSINIGPNDTLTIVAQGVVVAPVGSAITSAAQVLGVNDISPGDILSDTTNVVENTAGVTLSAELIQVTEGDATATYTVVLDSAPTSDVTITLNPGNQLSVNTPTLTFTPANFNIAQTVTVTAIDDAIGEGPHRGVISATVTSSDANYNGATVANVVAQITDNDIPQQDPTFQTPVTNPFGLADVGSKAAPVFADIDGDGDLDAFIGNFDGNTLFFENTGGAGSPAFAAPVVNPFGLTDVGYFSTPTFADIDGDGDLDAFIGERYGNTLFFENTGSVSTPAFAALSSNPFGLTNVGLYAAPTFADIDRDGDLDAFVGNNDGNTLFFENTGSASSPAFAAPSSNPFGLTNVVFQATPTFTDIDGDGDLDAFIGNSGDSDGNTTFFRNTGDAATPSFAAPTENPFGLTPVSVKSAPTFADIDGDGDLDAFIGDASGDTLFVLNEENQAPTVALDKEVTSLPENTVTPVKVADIIVTDDGVGTNNLSLSGADSALFEIQGTALFIKTGTILDFETQSSFDVTVEVDDPALGSTFEDSVDFSLSLQPLSLVVDTLVDENDGDFSAGELSLREALARIADGGTITFANSLAGGTITLNGTELLINKSLTINGDNGADITISGNNSSRVFLIDDGDGGNLAQVELRSLTITDGNTFLAGGAGILNQENLSFNNGALTGNSDNSSVGGGGIFNTGTATIVNSALSGNFAEVRGGGIFNGGTAALVNSTLSGNISGAGGGGITNSGTATIVNSTLSGNSADISGGGIVNESGTTSLTSAIVANNTATSSGNDLLRTSGTINASNSLIEDNDDQVNGTNTNNITGVDPLLGPLQDNGGPTQTLALLPGSPAIDAGSNPNNLTTDQRGESRSQGAGVDIGAFELQNQAPTVALDEEVTSLQENTVTPVKVADIIVTDDGVGTNNLSLTGADAAIFEIQGTALFIKTGTILDFETQSSFEVTVEVDDPALGSTFEDSVDFSLTLTDVNEDKIITGTPGKDRLNGTPNADIIDGLGGDDTLLGRDQDDLIFGREGNDTIQGNNGNDVIFGGAGLDRLSGDNNDDQLFGEAGNDSLVGGNGNDLLVGGQGKDTLAGGAGADKFDYQDLTDSLLSGFDTITDFRANADQFLVSNLPALFTPNAGKVSVLNATRISNILTPRVFANLGDAALFTNGAGTTTYLGLNGATPGFQANEDAILELRNFALAGTITGANFTLS